MPVHRRIVQGASPDRLQALIAERLKAGADKREIDRRTDATVIPHGVNAREFAVLADPLRDVTTLERVTFVMHDGKRVAQTLLSVRGAEN